MAPVHRIVQHGGRLDRRTAGLVAAPDVAGLGLDGQRARRLTGHLRVPGPRVSFSVTADRRHGLAVASGADPAGAVAVWFTASRTGWRAEPGVLPVDGTAACLAPRGDVAMVLGAAPALRARDGRSRPVTDLTYASDCALAGRIPRRTSHAGAARYDGSGALVVVDEHGTPRWLPAGQPADRPAGHDPYGWM